MMRKIMTGIAKVYMEVLTHVVIFASVNFLVDIGYDADWWRFGGCMDETFWVGFLAMCIYQVVRYQTRERLNSYMNKINPKIEQIAGALNRIENSSKDKVA